ncbi:hypothetical protein QBC37DRAFT_376945 [Rhypophila decipiens]|uniref:Uncharacterized protein n=1 Tax=Rhypophila decipiens TaxID=261697 RepID=A0AAN7B513_9PEZI|nr:hypothetical protein QBC37DRAFT_376945 [Rhypophila decipiens]
MAPIGPRDAAPMPECANWLPWVLTVAAFVGWAVQGVYGWWTARKLKKEISRLKKEIDRLRSESQRLVGADFYASGVAHLMAPAVVAAGGATPARVVLPPLVVPGPGAEVSAPPYPAGMSASALADEWLRAIALCRSIISGPAG